MNITAIAPWFGSKRSLGPTIAEELGPHKAYFDLCCGSMAVLFAKRPSSLETCVDMHGHLTNLAWVLQDEELADALYRRLQRTLCDESVFLRSREAFANTTPAGPPDVEAAYHFFIVSWVGRNGVAGTRRINYQMAVRWTPNGGHGGIRFESATESIPEWHRRLRRVLVLRRDVFKVLPNIDDVQGVAVYVDPPYLQGTRGAAKYEHEFDDGTGSLFADDDHAKLAEALDRFEHARVVVSYYDHPRLAELYPAPKWSIRNVARQKNLHVQNRRGEGHNEAPEVLILNGESWKK